WRCLRRTDRRRADAALRRPGSQPSPAARLQPLRGVSGRLPGQDSDSRDADQASRTIARRTGAQEPARIAGVWDVGANAADAMALSSGDLAGGAYHRPVQTPRSVAETAAGQIARLDRHARFPRTRGPAVPRLV